jgi:hypothetical protein
MSQKAGPSSLQPPRYEFLHRAYIYHNPLLARELTPSKDFFLFFCVLRPAKVKTFLDLLLSFCYFLFFFLVTHRQAARETDKTREFLIFFFGGSMEILSATLDIKKNKRERETGQHIISF